MTRRLLHQLFTDTIKEKKIGSFVEWKKTIDTVLYPSLSKKVIRQILSRKIYSNIASIRESLLSIMTQYIFNTETEEKRTEKKLLNYFYLVDYQTIEAIINALFQHIAECIKEDPEGPLSFLPLIQHVLLMVSKKSTIRHYCPLRFDRLSPLSLQEIIDIFSFHNPQALFDFAMGIESYVIFYNAYQALLPRASFLSDFKNVFPQMSFYAGNALHCSVTCKNPQSIIWRMHIAYTIYPCSKIGILSLIQELFFLKNQIPPLFIQKHPAPEAYVQTLLHYALMRTAIQSYLQLCQKEPILLEELLSFRSEKNDLILYQLKKTVSAIFFL